MSDQRSAISGLPENLDLVRFVNSVAIPVDVPERVLLVPWGTVTAHDSTVNRFVVDDVSAKSVIAYFKSWGGVDMVIDYEHGSAGGDYTPPGGKAPAAGWIKSLYAVPGEGIYGQVEWTEEAANYIRTKQYRYLSPDGMFGKADSRLYILKAVGLTNRPAITGMRPLVAKAGDNALTPEIWQQVRYWLNLPTTATEQQIMDELSKLLTQLRDLAGVPANADQGVIVAGLKAKLAATPPAAVAAVCKALNLPETASETDLVAAVNKAREVDPAKFVPAAEQARLAERVNSLEAQLSANREEAFLARGVKAGKITEATKDMWRGVFKSDPTQAAKHLETAPVIAPLDGKVVADASKGAAGTDRQAIILKAGNEFDANRSDLEKITCKAAYIDGELIAAGKGRLSDEETKKLG